MQKIRNLGSTAYAAVTILLVSLQGCALSDPTGTTEVDPEVTQWLGTLLTIAGVLTASGLFWLAWAFMREARRGTRRFRLIEWLRRRRSRERAQAKGSSRVSASHAPGRNSQAKP